MAFSPGRGSNVQSALHTGEQVRAAANTPAAATIDGIAGTSKKESNASQSTLFAPDHIPTLYHRIQRVSKLLIQASNDANSLSIPQSDSTEILHPEKKSDEAKMKEAISIGPDVTMGAMTEDDVTGGYEAALALTMNSGDRKGQASVKRTELAYSIVRESQALRDAFQHAQSAIDDMEGGEMDIEEQETLIKVLQDYNDDQNQVSRKFAIEGGEDVRMEED